MTRVSPTTVIPAKAGTHAEVAPPAASNDPRLRKRSMGPGLRRDDGNHIWRVPIILGGLTALGLVAALFGDGLWDAASAFALAAPLAVAAWHIFKPRK